MGEIVIIGLGPGEPKQLTREAWDALSTAQTIWLRTAHHPVTNGFPETWEVRSFDDIYEQAPSFEAVYETISQQVLDFARHNDCVTYAVPGHPLVGEATVTHILSAARSAGIPVRIVEGISFIEPTLTALSMDALSGLQIVDALDIVAMHHPPLNPDMPALVAQVYSRAVASDLKLVLMNQYPDEHLTALVSAAGTPAQSIAWGALYEIDRHEVDALTALYITPYTLTPPYKLPVGSSFEGFQDTIAQLRAPDGCPWDREQTHKSLRTNLLEEAYEVLTAIDADDPLALREELGDLLLQIVLQTQVAIEEGEFQMPEVIAGIDAKLKRRHPHVWGAVQVNDTDDVCVNWEALKRRERESNGKSDRSLLDGVPKTLPALARASAYGSRAARVGFDWADLQGVLRKVEEELGEFLAAQDPLAQTAELGDLLFAVANLARWLDIDPESALRETNDRFLQRFSYLEQEARRRDVPLEQMSPQELDALWKAAKALE